MKKILLVSLLIAVFSIANAQKNQSDSVSKTIQKNAEAIGQGGNNELKLNLLNAVLGIPEISYERILADNMGVGISVLAGLDGNIDYYKFGVIPHFRVYFGNKKASGFFIEANAAVMTVRDDNLLFYSLASNNYSVNDTFTNFGLGAAAGAKFLTRNGFLGEAYLGLGRFFGDNVVVDAYPRVGITIGKRF